MVFDKVIKAADDKEECSTRSTIRLVWRGMSRDVRGGVIRFREKSVKLFLDDFLIQSVFGFAPYLILGFVYKNDFRNPGLPLLLEANYLWL